MVCFLNTNARALDIYFRPVAPALVYIYFRPVAASSFYQGDPFYRETMSGVAPCTTLVEPLINVHYAPPLSLVQFPISLNSNKNFVRTYSLTVVVFVRVVRIVCIRCIVFLIVTSDSCVGADFI